MLGSSAFDIIMIPAPPASACRAILHREVLHAAGRSSTSPSVALLRGVGAGRLPSSFSALCCSPCASSASSAIFSSASRMSCDIDAMSAALRARSDSALSSLAVGLSSDPALPGPPPASSGDQDRRRAGSGTRGAPRNLPGGRPRRCCPSRPRRAAPGAARAARAAAARATIAGRPGRRPCSSAGIRRGGERRETRSGRTTVKARAATANTAVAARARGARTRGRAPPILRFPVGRLRAGDGGWPTRRAAHGRQTSWRCATPRASRRPRPHQPPRRRKPHGA